jgi:hypothetical protein
MKKTLQKLLVTGAFILALPVSNTAIGYGVTKVGLNHETLEDGREIAERVLEEYPESPSLLKAILYGNRMAAQSYLNKIEEK